MKKAATSTTPLNWPQGIVQPRDRYRHALSAVEAVRLKHNTRAGDLSPEARRFREECLSVNTRLIHTILELRGGIKTPGWQPRKGHTEADPLHELLKGEGYADHAAVDLVALTGVSLDAVQGASPEPPDPLEDFTGYTETDPGSDFTVTTNKIAVAALPGNIDAYVYDDKGAAHFGNTFTHYFKLTVASMDSNLYHGCWAVSNVIDDRDDWYGNDEACSVAMYATGGGFKPGMVSEEGSSVDWCASIRAFATPIYLTVERTANNAIQCRAYSDSGRTSLIDTMSSAIPTAGGDRAYRYAFGVVSAHTSQANTATFDVEDLDLNEAAAGNPWYYYQHLSLGAGV